MKKIRIFVYSLLAAVVLLLGVVLVAPRVPLVQRMLAKNTAAWLSDELQTEVSLHRVNVSVSGSLAIDSLRIADQQGRTLLQAHRLTAALNPWQLLKGRVRIAGATLEGLRATLVKPAMDGQPNYQFLVDALSKSDDSEPSALDLRIANFTISDGQITYDVLSEPRRELFDANHLSISHLNGQLALKELSADGLRLRGKRIALKERSGLDVRQLSFNLEVRNGQVSIDQAQIELPHSNLAVQLSTFNTQLSGYVAPSDLAWLLKELAPFHQKLNVSASATLSGGENQRVDVHEFALNTPTGSLSLTGNGQYSSAENWQADIQRAYISASDMQQVAAALAPKISLPDELLRLGSLDMRASAHRSNGQLYSTGTLKSDAGAVEYTLNDSGRNLQAHLSTSGLNLGKLLAVSGLGSVVGKATIEQNASLLTQQSNGGQTKIEADLNAVEYEGYTYRNIIAQGLLSAHSSNGNLTINDPNLQLNATLSTQPTAADKSRQTLLSAHVERLNAHALRLGEPWGKGVYAFDAEAELQGNSLKNTLGHLQISNLTEQNDDYDEPFRLHQLAIDISEDSEGRHTMLDADFGHLQIDGQYDYQTLSKSLTNLLASKLPTLPGLEKINPSVSNNLQVEGSLKSGEFLSRFFQIPIEVNSPIRLSGSLNDQTRQTNLRLDIPDMVYNGNRFCQGTVEITSPGDTLKAIVRTNRYMGNRNRGKWEILATAADNRLSTHLQFLDNGEKRIEGEINTESTFYQNEQGLPASLTKILPSKILINDTVWNVHPSEVDYYKKHLAVSDFSISHNGQHIHIDGCASENETDELLIDLNEVDVAYIMDLVNFHTVEFSGNATGQARISKAFAQPDAEAHIFIHDFRFETGRMGTLEAQARLNNELKQIDIEGIAYDGPFHQMGINGYVSPERNEIDLALDAQHVSAEFLQKMCGSIVKDVDLTATGKVNLVGPLSDVGMIGQLVADGRLTMRALGTTYEMKNDTVLFLPYAFRFANDTLTDRNGRKAVLDGIIRHRNLGHLRYDLGLELSDFLVYDFADYKEETFTGNVSASGNCRIQGTDADMVIDMNLSPTAGTQFVYNASSPDAIAETDFIRWHDVTGKEPRNERSERSERSEGVKDNTPDSQPSTLSSQPSAFNSQASTLSSEEVHMGGDLHINFLINATPDATLKVIMDDATGDYIALNGDGVLRASYYNKGPFHIYGNYVVDHGIYKLTIQNIIKKDFQMQQGGTIAFGGEPYEAPINLQAKYTVNAVSLADLQIGKSFSNNNIRVDCLMNISGTPNAPAVDFALEFPTLGSDAQKMVSSLINSQEEMNQQVLYLLAIGRFYSQGNNNADAETASQQSQTSLAMQSLLSGTISQQINNVLSSVVNNANWNFGANISTGDEGWNNAEYEGILSGRMLNNRLLFNGQFGYRDNANATTSFIGDFDLRYLLFPNGNFAINVYNETSDRYFTKNSINTQGIGLIMKKDFTSLRDLLGLKKKTNLPPAPPEGKGE